MREVRSNGGAAKLDRQSPVPLWAQLLDDLRARFDAMEFEGSFPSELHLSEEYLVSRNTVREAVRRLRSEGVVVAGRGRRPRIGSSVAIEQPVGALYSLFRSVESAGIEQRSVVKTLAIESNPDAARKLGLRSTARLFHLQRVRLAGGEPLALDSVWLPADIGTPLLESDFSHTALYDELAARTGVRLTGGNECIHAVVPDGLQRSQLEIPPDIAALAIDRVGFAKERLVEWRQTVVRGDRFNVVASFSAGVGYRLDLAQADGDARELRPGVPIDPIRKVLRSGPGHPPT